MWVYCIVAAVLVYSASGQFKLDKVEAEAVPDCYFSFLEYTGNRFSCGSRKDCANNARCVYSLNLMRRICCQERPGTVQPACPDGYTYADAAMPILCNPKTRSTNDTCPGKYTCMASTTQFTKTAYQQNYICCTAK